MKKRSRLLVVLFPLLGVLCLAATLFSQNKSEPAKSEFIPVSLSSLLEADYRANLGSVRLPALRLELIWDAISDREPHVDNLDARRMALLDSLQTPVPVVTPSVCQGSHIVYASQDTWLDSAQPTATHGDDPSLSIGRDGDQLKRILLFFPIGDSLPPGVYIKSARLELTPITETADIGQLQLFSLAAPFAELTASWSNQPPPDRPYRAAVLPASKVHSWDLTDMVQNWLLDYDSMSGLLLEPAAAFNFTQLYYSREADRQTNTQVGNANQPVGPRLVIDCGGQPQPPPAIAAAPQTAIPDPTPIPTSTGSMTPLPPAAPTQTAVASPPPTVVIPTLPRPSPTALLPSPSPAPTQPPALPSPTPAPPTSTALPPTPTAPPSTADPDEPDEPDEPTPALPVLAINGVTITEGDGGTLNAIFDVTLSAASPNPVTVDFTVADNSATAPADYIAASGALTFAPGVTRQSITVLIQGDTLDEADETFFVSLFNPRNATLSAGQALGRILDNDPPPALSIAGVTTPEGDSGVTDAVFSLSTASGQMVTVDYSTLPRTAAAADDYLTVSGRLTFPPGALTQTISVAVIGDTVVEANETFLVELSNPVNAAIAANQAVGTILNDDGLTISIGDVTVTEGDTGTAAAIFTVSLSTSSALPVQVDYATADNSAAAPADYIAIPTTTLTFAPGVTSQPIIVNVRGDSLDELDETFLVNLANPSSGTLFDPQGVGVITDDDSPPLVDFASPSYSLAEAGGSAIITVTLSAPSALTATVDYATTNNSAIAGSDYQPASGRLTFPPGTTVQIFAAPILDDPLDESDETVNLTLANPDNAVLGGNTPASLTILDDDLPPTLAIDDVTVLEGNSGTTDATFTVTLAAPSSLTVTVDYVTVDGSATAPADYISRVGTLTFGPGTTSQPITVAIQGDTLDEIDETFLLNLSNAVNTNISDAQGIGTITDDDNPPTLSINDVTTLEGNSGATDTVFTVTLSQASSLPVTVDYATANDTAVAGSDYTAIPTTNLTFNPGVTTRTITVTVQGDTLDEADETFFINLSGATNATIVDNQGLGIITDNDNSASLCASPMITLTATADTYLRSNQSDSNFGSEPDLRTKPPDNERNTLIQFDLATVPPNSLITCAALLLTQTSLPDTGQNVNIHRVTNSWLESQATWTERLAGTPWDTPGGGGDFDLTIEATFVPSATNHAANVTSLAQFWLDNPTANFGLLMEAQNAGSNGEVQFASREDGGNPSPRLVIEYIPTLSINDVTVTEGDSGATSAVFTVTLSAASAQTVSVNYATGDGSATAAGNDYTPTSGTLTFSPGVTTQPITVTVIGDLNSEATETFLVNLSNPTNAAISAGQGIGTILQDVGGLSRPAQNSVYLPLIVK